MSREFPPEQFIAKLVVSVELSEKVRLTWSDVSSTFFTSCLSKIHVPFFFDNSDIAFVSKP